MIEEPDSAKGCPPDIVFAELLEGRLAGPRAEALRRHADGCERCRAALLGLDGDETGDGIARALLGRGAREGSAVGDTVDRKYRLLRLLGKGGMGAVYEAEHADTGRRVAVKLIHGLLLERGGDAEARFRREARAAGAMESPHVVAVLDAGQDDATGDRYLVMELLRGEDLQHLLDRVGPLPPHVALRIAAQALEGLARAHEAGIVHRDVKPANLFLATHGDREVTVKVLDFGVAKVKPDALRALHTAGLSETTGLLGSPLYMSPEQMESSRDVDARTDLWSLGSVLYCALSGRAPFQHVQNVVALALAVRSPAGPQPLRALAPWVPPEIAEVVARALAVDPDERWPNAAAMLAAIQALLPGGLALEEEMLAGVPPEARAGVPSARPAPTLTPPTTPWRRPARIVALVVVAGAALAAALSLASREHEPRARDAATSTTDTATPMPTSPFPRTASASDDVVPTSTDPAPPAPSALPVASSHTVPRPPVAAPPGRVPPSPPPAPERPAHRPGVVEEVPF